VKIRMVQQMSGGRGDGQDWPPPGGELTVSDEEGMLLCSTSPSQPTPIAVPVAEERAAPAAPKPDPRVETRIGGGGEVPASPSPVPPRPLVSPPATVPAPPGPEVTVPPRRGPGRPPGSTNRPKP
jgi:hypothetical protein